MKNKFVISAASLVTTKEARRAGFFDLTLRRSLESTEYLDMAKALQVRLEADTKCCQDVLKITDLQEAMLDAAGVSVKSRRYLESDDKETILKDFVEKILSTSGNMYTREIIHRYLLTKGDALGGRMRNITGSIAEGKFVRALISQLRIANRDFSFLDKSKKWKNQAEYSVKLSEEVKAIRWISQKQERQLFLNIKVPEVNKNVDLVLFSQYLELEEIKKVSSYLAFGELKGGIDPAGADEHWKTANTALGRIRNKFPTAEIFFVGAAIEKAMSKEIYRQLQKGDLSSAANLTDENQLSALCLWLSNI